jgi:hypothetical protein
LGSFAKVSIIDRDAQNFEGCSWLGRRNSKDYAKISLSRINGALIEQEFIGFGASPFRFFFGAF